MLYSHTISVSNRMEFGAQRHWVWCTKALGMAYKSMEIEIQPQQVRNGMGQIKKIKKIAGSVQDFTTYHVLV